ncbi:MAG: cache domain-containing protein, partial [Sporomusaceae bacterium]|nr:cache domain-containing protein [Sporomusaceae bacterium]
MLTFKIKGKLIGCVMVMFFVIFAVFVAVIVTKTTEMAQNEAYELLLARSAAEAKAVETEIGGAVQTAKTLAQTLGSYESITDADSRRGLFNEMLQTTIAANPQYLTVWTCWEPNALDGLDEKYKNTLFHDATGRYIPTFTNTGGTVTAEALVGYDKPNEGDYYFASFHSGKTLVSEPYKYNLNGKETLLISISTPVKNKAGRTVGVVGIDMSADVLNERNDQVNIFETGVGKLVSGGGMMVAAQHRQVIGKPDADFQDSAGQERLKKI